MAFYDGADRVEKGEKLVIEIALIEDIETIVTTLEIYKFNDFISDCGGTLTFLKTIFSLVTFYSTKLLLSREILNNLFTARNSSGGSSGRGKPKNFMEKLQRTQTF
jgi:hypothetical protein